MKEKNVLCRNCGRPIVMIDDVRSDLLLWVHYDSFLAECELFAVPEAIK